MTLNELDILLRHPQQITGDDNAQLKAIIDQYPYFQSVRSLYLKSLYANKSNDYNQELRVTAAHTLDRDTLFDFIVSPDFITYKPLQINTVIAPLETKAVLTEEDTSLTEDILINATNDTVLAPSIVNIDKDEIRTEETEEEVLGTASNTIDDLQEVPAESTDKLVVEEEGKKDIPEPKLTSTAIKSLLQSITIHENQQLNPTPISEEVSDTPTERVSATVPKNETASSETVESKQTEIDTLESKLEIGTPISFDKKEKLSFTEWLQLSKIKPIDRENDSILTDLEYKSDIEKQKKSELIDKFIETNPKIVPTKKPTIIPANIDTSVQENSSLMTETLAKIYLEQKKYQKAIQAYEILILKYPEKSSFFANQISDIKALQQHNS